MTESSFNIYMCECVWMYIHSLTTAIYTVIFTTKCPFMRLERIIYKIIVITIFFMQS